MRGMPTIAMHADCYYYVSVMHFPSPKTISTTCGISVVYANYIVLLVEMEALWGEPYYSESG